MTNVTTRAGATHMLGDGWQTFCGNAGPSVHSVTSDLHLVTCGLCNVLIGREIELRRAERFPRRRPAGGRLLS